MQKRKSKVTDSFIIQLISTKEKFKVSKTESQFKVYTHDNPNGEWVDDPPHKLTAISIKNPSLEYHVNYKGENLYEILSIGDALRL